jgi:hypothetical protein
MASNSLASPTRPRIERRRGVEIGTRSSDPSRDCIPPIRQRNVIVMLTGFSSHLFFVRPDLQNTFRLRRRPEPRRRTILPRVSNRVRDSHPLSSNASITREHTWFDCHVPKIPYLHALKGFEAYLGGCHSNLSVSARHHQRSMATRSRSTPHVSRPLHSFRYNLP